MSQRRRRVGFVVDWLRDSYQLAVLEGAAEEAENQGVDLVVLPGGVIGADHEHGIRRNRIYQLIDEQTFSALVVMTGTLGNAGDVQVMSRICPDFPADRICHVAIAVEGSPSILIDNHRGIRSLVEHLHWVHRCRHIAFIRGPESNEEAEARYQAYRDALQAVGLPFDERLVCPGNFLRSAGTDAIRILLDERGVLPDELDAIVAADDLMALAAMEELARRRIRVPADVAVVGFDDVDEARYATPPLSTVQQPLRLQGKAAVQAALASSDVKPLVLDTVSIFRRSCGCTAEDPGFLTMRPKVDTRLSLEASVERRRTLIISELERTLAGTSNGMQDGWEGELFDALLASIRGDEGAFRERFDLLLGAVVESRLNAELGQVLVSGLRRQLSVCAGDDVAQIRQVESLLHDARILASHAMARAEAQKRIELECQARVLTEVSLEVGSATSERRVAAFAECLPRLGITDCLVCEYSADNQASVVFHLEGGELQSASAGRQFPAPELGPPEIEFIRRNGNLIVQPFDDGTSAIGFAVLELRQIQSHLIEVVRDLLCHSLGR